MGLYAPTTYLSIGNSLALAGPAARIVAVVTSLAGAAALVAFGKIFSAQCMVWVVFAAPLALERIRPFVLSATVSATLLTLYVYDWGPFDLIAGGRTSWVLLTRNLILVGLFGLLLVELAARDADVRRAPVRKPLSRSRG